MQLRATDVCNDKPISERAAELKPSNHQNTQRAFPYPLAIPEKVI